ncbi:peroxisome biogenesis factor 2 [Neodiprion fabricii]|uniref:peroxisome biogenesis factor 2 n=1 Tax=Neodiprion fabricii TaxID=2872261 RepID=UPI001ED8E5BC|nr:peroxisome biogenesis factor 2 [Neodiprion fabricii]
MATSAYVSRINQIDASQLDKEIYHILQQQTTEISKLCTPGTIGKWQPEINALLKVVVWNYSLRTGNSTFGQQLLNLHYDKYSKKKAILYIILSVVPGYLQEKMIDNRLIGSMERGNQIRRFLDWISTTVRLLTFVNILVFLNQGNQPNIIERVLGIYNRPTTTQRPRNIGYSYMTRELLWHSLIELFTIGLPMVNVHLIKQRIKRIWWTRKIIGRSVAPKLEFDTKCPECDQSPNLPRHAGCEHIFCYYCMKARFTVDNSFECPSCGVELHSAQMRTA